MVYKALKKDAVRHFTSVRDPASFSSASKLRKHYFKKTALRHVEDALQSVDAYTKHKPYKRRFPRRKTQTWGIDKQWQLDLIEMLPFKKYNKGYSYIMVAIGVFSRYAFAEAVKSKEGKSVTKAFKTMIKERCPLYVQTDKGKEFLNKHFKDLMKERGITFFTGENSDYNSNEQSFQCTKAERHDNPEMAATLKEMTNSQDIKVEASNITTSEEWNQISPDLLWDMFDRKMTDNPQLLERLIQTAPLPLIEASTSMRWGGGEPRSTPDYTIRENLKDITHLAVLRLATVITKLGNEKRTIWNKFQRL